MCRKLREYNTFLWLLCSSVGGHYIAFKEIPWCCWVSYEQIDRMQFGTIVYFWSGLQIAGVAKIQTDLYWQYNSSNYSGNHTANTLGPSLSCGVRNDAKPWWYAAQFWVPCCTCWLITWWGTTRDWDKKIHTTRF